MKVFAGKSDTVGRYMVARRNIMPGEVVFTDQPAVIGPDNAAVPMCLVCWRYAILIFPLFMGSELCPPCSNSLEEGCYCFQIK